MKDKITAKRLKEVGKEIRKSNDDPQGPNHPEHLFITKAFFVPSGIPTDHLYREFFDGRAYTDNAPQGYWDVMIWDIDNDAMPVAMAAFVGTDSHVVCDRLSVLPDYRGQQLGQRLIDLGERLWERPIADADQFDDAKENFWCSAEIYSEQPEPVSVVRDFGTDGCLI